MPRSPWNAAGMTADSTHSYDLEHSWGEQTQASHMV